MDNRDGVDKGARIAEIHRKLEDLGRQVMAIATGVASNEDWRKLEKLTALKDELRAELDKLGDDL